MVKQRCFLVMLIVISLWAHNEIMIPSRSGVYCQTTTDTCQAYHEETLLTPSYW